jgi:hypothetical protein
MDGWYSTQSLGDTQALPMDIRTDKRSIFVESGGKGWEVLHAIIGT